MPNATSANWIVELMAAAAWPAVAAAVIYWFRTPIRAAIETLGPHVNRVSVAGISIELQAAKLREKTPVWSAGGTDIRALAPITLSDSSSQAFVRALASPVEQEYAVIDLGQGQKWLASRLFIISLILENTSRLRAFVFLETTEAGRGRFIGVAEPRAIHRALGVAYPWFDAAFASAYSNIISKPEQDATTLPWSQEWQTVNLLNQFLSLIRLPQEPPEEKRPEYVKLSGQMWEKTRWLDGGRLERRLGSSLSTSRHRAANRRLTEQDKKDILNQEGMFVAVLNEDGKFHSLIDRQLLMERHI